MKFKCRVVSSSIKEDKKTEDHIILTKFNCVVSKGFFNDFSEGLEQILENGVWDKLNTGTISGVWEVKISETVNGKSIADIKNCVIKDVKLKHKDDTVEMDIIIKHKLSQGQFSLETAVSQDVMLELIVMKNEDSTSTEE